MCAMTELAPVHLHKGECPVAGVSPVDLDLGGAGGAKEFTFWREGVLWSFLLAEEWERQLM
jgi:hypothetical protein